MRKVLEVVSQTLVQPKQSDPCLRRVTTYRSPCMWSCLRCWVSRGTPSLHLGHDPASIVTSPKVTKIEISSARVCMGLQRSPSERYKSPASRIVSWPSLVLCVLQKWSCAYRYIDLRPNVSVASILFRLGNELRAGVRCLRKCQIAYGLVRNWVSTGWRDRQPFWVKLSLGNLWHTTLSLEETYA